MNEFIIVSMREDQIATVANLLLAQQARQCAHDPRLRAARSYEQVTAHLTDQLARGEPILVALDTAGRVRGYASPGVWELSETSILRAFLPERAGVTHELALADRSEGDASRVLRALLVALSSWWREQETTGELIRWPAANQWVVARLAAHGFQLDSVCAMRAPEQPRGPTPLSTASCIIRPARPVDEAALVNLFAEELEYHERCTAFVCCNPIVLAAFRRKLVRLWDGNGLEAGAPFVLVAECDGEVIGMAETTLLHISPDDEPGFTPPGCYGCLDNVCVQEPRRGQGIGRQLVQAVYDAFAALPLSLDGWLLWYNPDNRQAARFWTQQGFIPLWTTYQRLHPSVEE